MKMLRNNYGKHEKQIDMNFTCKCPITGDIDRYNMWLRMEPNRYIIEDLSFKEYISGFECRFMYMEEICREILDKICDKIDPEWIRITLRDDYGMKREVNMDAKKILCQTP